MNSWFKYYRSFRRKLILLGGLDKSCFLLLVLILIGSNGQSQSKEQLRNQRQRLLNEISEANSLLSKTRSDKKVTLADMSLLQNQIANRQKLIDGYNKEVGLLNAEIRNTNTEITNQNKELDQLRASYEKAVVSAYKRRNVNSRLLFLFSAKSVNDAFKRFSYLKKYNSYQKSQSDRIKSLMEDLERKRNDLQKQKTVKLNVLSEQQVQQRAIGLEKKKLEAVLSSLKKNEKNLQAQITSKRNEAKRLEREIDRIIAREIENERKRLEALKAKENNTSTPEAPKTPDKKPALGLTPEAAKLANNFSKNKGKLPWPVERGAISSTFGEHSSKELRGIKTVNNGIDIRTNANAPVRAIFDGEVRSITTIPGYNRVVIISHGSYFTVYGKLNKVAVNVGDKVSTGQTIGTTDTVDGISEVHLEIWQGRNKLNPISWIAN